MPIVSTRVRKRGAVQSTGTLYIAIWCSSASHASLCVASDRRIKKRPETHPCLRGVVRGIDRRRSRQPVQLNDQSGSKPDFQSIELALDWPDQSRRENEARSAASALVSLSDADRQTCFAECTSDASPAVTCPARTPFPAESLPFRETTAVREEWPTPNARLLIDIDRLIRPRTA